MTEEQLVSAIMDLAALSGWKVVHYRPARSAKGWRTPLAGHAGAPDIIAVHPVRGVLMIEAKSDKGRLREEQQEWAWAITEASRRYPEAIRYAVIRPSHYLAGYVQELLLGPEGTK